MVRARLLKLVSGPGEEHVSDSVERLLACARAVLAVVSLVAIYLDPTEPRRFVPLAYTLLIAYSLFSVVMLGVVWTRPVRGVRHANALHAVDVVWASALTVISEGPSSPFFPLFVFVLLTAAYRRDLRATLITGGCIVILLIAEIVLVDRLWPETAEPLEVNRIIIRCAYLMLVALLVGYVAQREKQLRAEAWLVARLSAGLRVDRGLSAGMQAVLRQLLDLTALASARVFFHESASDSAYLWTAEADAPAAATPFHWRELGASESRAYSFDLHPDAVVLQAIQPAAGPPSTRALDRHGRWIAETAADVQDHPAGERFEQVVCVPIPIADDSMIRLFLMGTSRHVLKARDLAALQRLVRQVFPAMYNLYLVRRLRTRVGEIERARVARELHDGVIQSLLGLEMELDVLRRARDVPPSIAGALAKIQSALHEEALNVRDLMHQMRPLKIDSRNVLQAILDIVERFRRETGMHVQFVSRVEEVALSPRTCQELARVVQEALVNVRRNSGASNVVITLSRAGRDCRLTIDDDGRGFDFEGRLGQDALDAIRKGPIVIKERVRQVGGTLAIDSSPGAGSRLEITIPVRRHA